MRDRLQNQVAREPAGVRRDLLRLKEFPFMEGLREVGREKRHIGFRLPVHTGALHRDRDRDDGRREQRIHHEAARLEEMQKFVHGYFLP